MVSKTAVRRSVPSGELPAFTPVPRKVPRHDGWTPERQRAFIAALADTGCVAIAARMVNMSQSSCYQLRRQPGAQGFRAAWDAAQALGLQVCKDEAFDRAMNGQLVPVFVAGKLMGFRRKKNDGLLMFILRHYGQDAGGRKTTVNYFSTRASAGTQNPSLSRSDGEGDRVHRGGGASSLAAAEASTTTVKTVITGSGARSQLADDDAAANTLNAFEGVELDAQAQAQIYRALESCAERRRALENDPQDDPERYFIGKAETNLYLGELESGVESDWVEYQPEGEHSWDNLGEGGNAAEIDEVVAGIHARRAKLTPEQIAAEEAEHKAEVQRMREAQTWALPPPVPEPDPESLPRTGSGDPRMDWRNWTDAGHVAPSIPSAHPEPALSLVEGPVEGQISPRTGRPLKRYRKRTPKPAFVPPTACPGPRSGEARKAQAVSEVEAERRELAAAEAERRRRRKKKPS